MKKIILAFSLLFSSYGIADIWYVPGYCPTIQAALDSCSTGDTVLVSPGIYYESIIWPNTQSIYLMSEFGADSTIIETEGLVGYGFEIVTGVDTTTAIEGFTIQGFIPGGIYFFGNSSPTIKNNIIKDNGFFVGGTGGIVCMDSSSPNIINNIIKNNVATEIGGGIKCYNSSPTITNNVITENYAEFLGEDAMGGGIYCYQSNPIISGNSITKNLAEDGMGGGIYCYRSNPTITGNTINENTGIGGGIYCLESSPTINNNNITINIGGGIYCYLSNPLINYNNICDNSDYGVFNYDTVNITVINAEFNWWGDISGPGGVGPGIGDEVSDNVDYEPWLNNPITEVRELLTSSVPVDYQVNQNYPNPFNPSTKIRYSVPQLSRVVIKVFDVLGNEIETLVNEEKPSGTYELTWYAEGLPSGVYFYQLKAGSFVETKKMVLLR